MLRFGLHLENQLFRFPTKILPMMGFLTCDDCVMSRWPKLVSLGGSSIEPFSHLQCDTNEINKQQRKKEAAHAGAWIQGVVQCCTVCGAQYAGRIQRCLEVCGV